MILEDIMTGSDLVSKYGPGSNQNSEVRPDPDPQPLSSHGLVGFIIT